MGFAKATAPLAGASPLARLGGILGGRSVTIVTARALVAECSLAIPGARVLVNATPEAGMTSSLAVAHHALAPDVTLGVILADKPFVREETLVLCERAYAAEPACDVLFPTLAGEPGHPVYFGARARARLAAAPAGDTLRAVRDDPELKAVAVECSDPGIVDDLDTPGDWHEAERRLAGERPSERESGLHA
jgi:CTP:molybdopterin cytidylyltransferase MocA